MIASPIELVDHLKQVVHGLDESQASGYVAELGPLRIELRLHGAGDHADFFEVFPPVRPGALSKQASRAQSVDFAIEVIDGARCGVKRPGLKWRASDFGLKRIVPAWSNNKRTTYFLRSECGLAVADWRAGHAYVWVPSIEAITARDRAAPFRWLLDGLAQRHSLTTMHAAVIGEGGIGLLVVGESGRGKSTLALAAISAGMDYLADDYCLLDARPPYRAYRLFNTAKLRADARVQSDWIADSAHKLDSVNGGKQVFNLARSAPGSLADRLEIRALILTEFTDEALPVLDTASPNEAFRRAAPSTIAQCEGSEAQVTAEIGHLVRQLPCFRIRMPRDSRLSIDRMRDLIHRLRKAPENVS
jgi:hypothetical protein